MKEENIVDTIIVVMSVIIISVISALIVGTLLSNNVFSQTSITGTINNETLIGVTNTTASDFSIISTYPSATCSLNGVWNATGGESIASGNYTYSSCSIILTDTSSYIGSDINVSYSFSRLSGTNVVNVNTTQIGNDFGSFITGLVGFLAIIGTILGVVWLISYVKKLFGKEGMGGLSNGGLTA